MSIQNLSRAIAENTSSDAFALTFSVQQWETLVGYLQPIDTSIGDVLIEQGTPDRSVFFIESGAISVHRVSSKEQMKLAVLTAGSVVGEGSFFSRLPHSANVVVTGAGRVWRLTAIRFAEMSNRQPNLALEISMALGAVIAKRMAHRSKRVAVT
ncbi:MULTISPECIES: Crp/Fnr family transcriptional regulator [Variovorax]|jgi:CRP/FNR family transcriptional regulator, cyclic AMP receptor protein|uniref:Crp/Fnr family transcriptional regulator n=1 Tax=Variovorax TaxID=34072 RepID=UPI00086F8CBA|nr:MULTISPECIES: cyclic nucleotide-binding domain-containing protein [Variovorax]MBN8755234.1 cyclic nucleotide-binding domain-containing protein [Variovorax sp.]ODU16011.1 MAG: Crp/Fnr family transcriptional regulator [Variovorax sp. SCN 67-85]ODV15702.1 MAG: Crp/Fnr family transcriptional regulator [Variovorax sp. SCN 67-20]OJZ14209.1 MAG: Crp/Fnr family transcriptional regulator [Variovorax sp. 67-131]UKI08389.1 cyclic nucleotide-binding domain-containing protein [Variovorax paradoxus]